MTTGTDRAARSADRFGAPLRVAIVAPSMRILGGQAVQADRLLRAWADDPDVRAWLVPVNPLPPGWLRRTVDVKYLRTVVTELTYWPLLLRELRRADVVHVFSASYLSFLLAPLPAVLVAKLLGRPVVLNYRSGQGPDHLARSWIARATLASVDRNLVPSRFLRDVFASFGLDADVVPNIVDVERFRFRLRESLAPHLVSTRNFEPLYNVACTLRAFGLVQDEYPDATLTLVGGGSLDAHLRHLAARLGLRNVSFAGRVPPADIWRFYADADIYVQTPDIDNMPASLLEAFSSGTPVVSSDAGGVPAMLTDEVDGLLARAGDHHAVARQVLRLLREPGLAARLATTAREKCEQYTWPRVRDQWLAVYRSLAGGREAHTTSGVSGTTAMSQDLAEPGRSGGVEDPAPAGAKLVARRSRLEQLRGMESREVLVRARILIGRGLRRLGAAATGTRWRRERLAGRLVAGDASIRPTVTRLSEGDWMGAHRELMRHFQGRPPRFVLDPASRRAMAEAVASRHPSACEDSECRADAILAGRYDLLGYHGLHFDGPRASTRPEGIAAAGVDWTFDPVHGRRAADAWWSDIRYLDPANGDHKIIWELNRHQHWLALGRAYWLHGREQYRSRFVAELESWLQQNRPLVGINWASMLELALRSLSWIWALHFFLDDAFDLSKADHDVPWLVDLLLGLDRQLRQVEENLSHYFSPNTHLTGEALALYVAGRVLPELRAAARWEAVGRQILIEQASRQIAPDGGHLERSTHYHRYTLDFYLLALAVARRTGDTTAERAFEPIVARLARFAWAMADANLRLPRIGDDDAGMLMPFTTGDPADVRGSLSIAASLLPGHVPVEETTEESLWVVGPDARRPGSPLPRAHDRGAAGSPRRVAVAEWDGSAAFPATGYYVSRSRSGDHLVFDAGPHGFLNGGHAHADALAFTLSLRWHPFLIDTGTGTYTTDPALRDRFRSTALHNTLVLDGRPQSLPDGPFHWARAANGHALRWASNPRFDYVEASHDGFAPATHRRAIFSAAGEMWLVADHVLDAAPHTAEVHWHLDPEWHVRVEGHGVEARHPDGVRATIVSTARRLEVFRGDRVTGLGWCSPAYGRVVECPSLRFSRRGDAPFSVATLVLPHEAGTATIEPVPVVGGARVGYASAVRIVGPWGTDVVLFAVPSLEPARRGGPPRHTRQFAGFETDARFAWVRVGTGGEVLAASLVDGALVERVSADPFRLQMERDVRDAAVTLGNDGLLEVFSSARLPALAVEAPATAINRVHLNDSPASFRRDGGVVLVPSGQTGRVTTRAAESALAAR